MVMGDMFYDCPAVEDRVPVPDLGEKDLADPIEARVAACALLSPNQQICIPPAPNDDTLVVEDTVDPLGVEKDSWRVSAMPEEEEEGQLQLCTVTASGEEGKNAAG